MTVIECDLQDYLYTMLLLLLFSMSHELQHTKMLGMTNNYIYFLKGDVNYFGQAQICQARLQIGS